MTGNELYDSKYLKNEDIKTENLFDNSFDEGIIQSNMILRFRDEGRNNSMWFTSINEGGGKS